MGHVPEEKPFLLVALRGQMSARSRAVVGVRMVIWPLAEVAPGFGPEAERIPVASPVAGEARAFWLVAVAAQMEWICF